MEEQQGIIPMSRRASPTTESVSVAAVHHHQGEGTAVAEQETTTTTTSTTNASTKKATTTTKYRTGKWTVRSVDACIVHICIPSLNDDYFVGRRNEIRLANYSLLWCGRVEVTTQQNATFLPLQRTRL